MEHLRALNGAVDFQIVTREAPAGRQALQKKSTAAHTENALLLYPNPAGDVLKLAYPVLEGKAQIAVYDLTGRQLLHGVGASKSSAAEISVGGLTPGIYLVELRSGDGVVMRKTFTKK